MYRIVKVKIQRYIAIRYRALISITSCSFWCVLFCLVIFRINSKTLSLLVWMQLLLAMSINWTALYRTQRQVLKLHFVWLESQNSIIFISCSHIWGSCQTSLDSMFSKYMWLQLWFSMLFITKGESATHTKTCVLRPLWWETTCHIRPL